MNICALVTRKESYIRVCNSEKVAKRLTIWHSGTAAAVANRNVDNTVGMALRVLEPSAIRRYVILVA